MGERFRLRLCARRSGESSLSFGRRSGVREKIDFISDSTTEIVERFSNVGRVIVGFVCILGT